MSLQTDARQSPAPPSGAGQTAVPPPRPRPSRVWLSRLDIKASPYLYIAPFFVLFGIFGLFPLVYTGWVSLHDWEIIGPPPSIIGLQNYVDLMADDRFWNSVRNTFALFFIATVPQLLGALALANVLNRQMRGRTFFRMAIVVPSVTSLAAVAIVFNHFFARDYGMVNWLIDSLGFTPIDWRANQWASWIAISTIVDWRWLGYNALIYLAAMQAIPKDLYESAALDGAAPWRQFWSITIPMLRPTIIFTVIISTIGGLQLFTEPLVFGGRVEGGPLRQYQTVTMYLYEQGFGTRFELGYASAIALVLFVMILVFGALNYLIVRRLAAGSREVN